MDNTDNTIKALQDFLSGPDAKDKINEALSMLSDSDFLGFNSQTEHPPAKEPSDSQAFEMPDINPEKLLKIMTEFKKADKNADPRSALLSALKPYLKQDKQKRADKAIKIVKFLKYAPMLENFKDIFN